jgi:hypothetical protein
MANVLREQGIKRIEFAFISNSELGFCDMWNYHSLVAGFRISGIDRINDSSYKW